MKPKSLTTIQKNEVHMNQKFEPQVNLIWATPSADDLIARMARVSNPENQDNPSITGLLNFMMREGHVSPFEMANACVEINTTRDIGRQILRHRSFSFQEFSQRYASTEALTEAPLRECRMQDPVNRQNSIETDDESALAQWEIAQKAVLSLSVQMYHAALSNGIAKEQARTLLPEGLTSSRMYMNGTLRSWIFYLKQRLHLSTQKEHRLIADQILVQLRGIAPITMAAFFPV
jgi:thymidylate synthase (FAD)